MSSHVTPRLRQLLLTAVSLVILLLLARYVNWGELGGALARARIAPLAAALAVTLVFPLLNAFRWLAVLRAVGAPVPLGRAFRITMACWPIGVLTPGKAGEFLKATALHDRTLGVGTIYAERVIDIAILGVFGLVFGLWIGSFWCAAAGLLGLASALGVAGAGHLVVRLLGQRPAAARLTALLAVLPRLMARPRLLAACVLSSALNWWLSMVQMWYLLQAFGAPADLVLVMAIVPGATFIGLLPITIAGVGTRDAAFLFLGAGLIEPGALFAAALFYSLYGYFLLGAAGLPFLGVLRRHPSSALPGGQGLARGR